METFCLITTKEAEFTWLFSSTGFTLCYIPQGLKMCVPKDVIGLRSNYLGEIVKFIFV